MTTTLKSYNPKTSLSRSATYTVATHIYEHIEIQPRDLSSRAIHRYALAGRYGSKAQRAAEFIESRKERETITARHRVKVKQMTAADLCRLFDL